jgi:hypothetical protein
MLMPFCIWWGLGTNGPNFRSQKPEPEERRMYTIRKFILNLKGKV